MPKNSTHISKITATHNTLTLLTNLATALQSRFTSTTYSTALDANAEALRLSHILLRSPLCQPPNTIHLASALITRLTANIRAFDTDYRRALNELQSPEALSEPAEKIASVEIAADDGAAAAAAPSLPETYRRLNLVQQAQLSFAISQHVAKHAPDTAQVVQSQLARQGSVRGMLRGLPGLVRRARSVRRVSGVGSSASATVPSGDEEGTGEELLVRLEGMVKRAEEVPGCVWVVREFRAREGVGIRSGGEGGNGGDDLVVAGGTDKGDVEMEGVEEEDEQAVKGENRQMLLQFWEWNPEKKPEGT